MLVLTRKFQERIRIGHNITVSILRIKGNVVRLGIEAPANVTVLRGELVFDDEAEIEIEPEVGSIGTAEAEGRTLACVSSKAERGTKTGQDLIEGVRDYGAAPKVSLVRVPRKKLVGMLPKLISGSPPICGTSPSVPRRASSDDENVR
jgi:carbon storage regulator CsrA